MYHIYVKRYEYEAACSGCGAKSYYSEYPWVKMRCPCDYYGRFNVESRFVGIKSIITVGYTDVLPQEEMPQYPNRNDYEPMYPT